MRYSEHILSMPWSDYELIDSGDNKKLERFGEAVLVRPETQALWKKGHPKLWGRADAEFASREGTKGAWEVKKTLPDPWILTWNDIRISARLTSFKHVGIFPEQAPNWEWLEEQVRALRRRVVASDARSERAEEARGPAILNHFGYTGIASIAAAKAGAFVTHVDASKQSIDWAHDNAKLSGLSEDKIRWILEDALSFAKREARRGTKYDGILLDPPAFGRGAKGEVWRIEENLYDLLTVTRSLLKEEVGSFFLLNGYAAGYSELSFAQAIENVFHLPVHAGLSAMPAHAGQAGELHIKEASSDRVVPSGIYVRFVR